MPEELNLQDIQNILTFMGRVDMKGGEAHAYVTAEVKLKMMQQRLQNEGPAKTGAPAGGDGDADTTS